MSARGRSRRGGCALVAATILLGLAPPAAGYERSPLPAREAGGSDSPAVVPTLVRGPYLQQETESGITVRWHTDIASPSRLLYGTSPTNLIWSEESSTPTTAHVITLSGLTSDTKYYYAVGDDTVLLVGEDADHYFVTAPLRGTAKPTRVWVVGDSGTGNAHAMAVRDAYLNGGGLNATDLWLMLGDNAYPSGTDAEYQTALFDIYPTILRNTPLWPTLGNHDAVSASSSTESGPYYDIFTLPRAGESGGFASGTEAYYSFDYANIHFVVLDSSDSDRSLGSPMLIWLAADLASTAQDWVIALWHHPPYSKGSHDSDNPQDSGGRMRDMRENVLPLLDAYGVDLVLTGHSHSYERSYLLDGHYDVSAMLVPSMILDDGDGSMSGDGPYWKPDMGPAPHRGAVHTVAGCSGLTSGGSLDHPAMHVSLNTLGSVVLDIDGQRLDASFLDSTGVVQDEFTIVKGCSGIDFSSRDTAGDESFLYTPGLCDSGPPCGSDIDSSVSSSLAGSFWQAGEGDPAPNAGVDNGAYPALKLDGTGWVKTDDVAGPAWIDGEWSSAGGVDGCINLSPSADCMALILADQNNSIGYFAALTAEAAASGEYGFDQPGGAHITLAQIPLPLNTASHNINSYTKTVDLFVQPPASGLYLDPSGCGAGLVSGYRVYQFETPRDAPAPVDRTIASGWTLSVGGELPNGNPIPLGQSTTITLTCYTAVDIHVASTLVFESGFELSMVSRRPFYVLCSNCETDDDQDGVCKLFITGAPGTDCDDDNSAVYPAAPQICGDATNNNCNHPNWPALTGTNEFDDDGDGLTECQDDCDDSKIDVWSLPSEVPLLLLGPGDDQLIWSPSVVPGGNVVRYDLLRSSQASDFDDATVCVAQNSTNLQAQDSDSPSVGATFYYLVRPENLCGAGSLGTNSAGGERSGRSCP